LKCFILNVHHGGTLLFATADCDWSYEGEDVERIESADIDRISMVCLDKLLTVTLGYTTEPLYFMKSTLCDKLECICSDELLLEVLSKTLKTKWEVNIYCDHPDGSHPTGSTAVEEDDQQVQSDQFDVQVDAVDVIHMNELIQLEKYHNIDVGVNQVREPDQDGEPHESAEPHQLEEFEEFEGFDDFEDAEGDVEDAEGDVEDAGFEASEDDV
jgi:hypothetical protein